MSTLKIKPSFFVCVSSYAFNNFMEMIFVLGKNLRTSVRDGLFDVVVVLYLVQLDSFFQLTELGLVSLALGLLILSMCGGGVCVICVHEGGVFVYMGMFFLLACVSVWIYVGASQFVRAD